MLLSNQMHDDFIQQIILFITPLDWVDVRSSVIVVCSQNAVRTNSITEENGKLLTVGVISAKQNNYNKYNLLTSHFQNLFKHIVLGTVHCKVLICISL